MSRRRIRRPFDPERERLRGTVAAQQAQADRERHLAWLRSSAERPPEAWYAQAAALDRDAKACELEWRSRIDRELAVERAQEAERALSAERELAVDQAQGNRPIEATDAGDIADTSDTSDTFPETASVTYTPSRASHLLAGKRDRRS